MLDHGRMSHPTGKIPNISLSKTITAKVGGVAGLGSSQATAIISLEKLTFAPGENIKVKINMDNSKCKKPVKSFKIKLSRKISCFTGKPYSYHAKPVLHEIEYIEAHKYEG